MARPDLSTPEGRARRRAKELTGFFWHLGTYVVITAFLWWIMGGAVVWVAAPWGIGLAFHGLATLLSPRGFESRKYEQFLEDERRREAMLEDDARRKEMVR